MRTLHGPSHNNIMPPDPSGGNPPACEAQAFPELARGYSSLLGSICTGYPHTIEPIYRFLGVFPLCHQRDQNPCLLLQQPATLACPIHTTHLGQPRPFPARIQASLRPVTVLSCDHMRVTRVLPTVGSGWIDLGSSSLPDTVANKPVWTTLDLLPRPLSYLSPAFFFLKHLHRNQESHPRRHLLCITLNNH